MKVNGIRLGWIVVKDLAEAIEFYENVVGLTLKERMDEHGWAELQGPDGCRLGIAQESDYMDTKAGSNAIMAISVEDMDEALKHYKEKGAKLVGDVIEVPGNVKMQTVVDADGNVFQIVQDIEAVVT